MTSKMSQTLLCRAYAHDASHYLMYPSSVRIPSTVEDVRGVFNHAKITGSHLTFRAGGTSLNGQAITEGILVDVRRNFCGYKVEQGGAKLRAEPGLTVRMANAVLRRHGYKIGPDPASEIAATLGGVLANNASGMACGTRHNTYQMLDSLTFMTVGGTLIDTAGKDADRQFAKAEPVLYQTLLDAKEQVLANPDLVAEIRRQFSIKNTMGYSLEALLDYDRPVDIFAHLLVGSEGTLAFVSEIVLNNLPIKEHCATALLVFPSLPDATRMLPKIIDTQPEAVELMDSASLKVGQSFDVVPTSIEVLDVVDQVAFILEYQGESVEDLSEQVAHATEVLSGEGMDPTFTWDLLERTKLWSFRKGLYTSVAGARTPGATALLEDIAVSVDRLTDVCVALNKLFVRYNYEDAVIFGHAKDGNMHFMITDHFDSPDAVRRLEQFTDDMTKIVLAEGGSLKAEHGTGRTMTPYVLAQFGQELFDIMVSIKRAADPHKILNPGVIFQESSGEHFANLKPFPLVNPLIDKCVECGYCEPTCPSEHLTLTPRMRIVMEREMVLAQKRGDTQLVQELTKLLPYFAVETCAVDGMCGLACPVEINTGDLVRFERAKQVGWPWTAVWGTAAKHWSFVTQFAGVALTVAKKMPASVINGATVGLRKVLGDDHMPLWTKDLPAGGKSRKAIAHDFVQTVGSQGTDPVAVYMPSCLNTMFKQGTGSTSVQEDFLFLCHTANVSLRLPENIDSTCCGTPWSSKGITAGYATNKERTMSVLRDATENGKLPVVCDASSCTEGLQKMLVEEGFSVVDAPTFLVEHVLPTLSAMHDSLSVDGSVVIHPTCASTKLGSFSDIKRIADCVSDVVTVPDGWGCCAFAGDRGMLHPELTASATKREASEVTEIDADFHVSSNRTCEIGMSRATGKHYGSIISLLASAVRRKS